MPATNYDDPNLGMTEEEIIRQNVMMGIHERDPEYRPEDEASAIWDYIESGDLDALTRELNK